MKVSVSSYSFSRYMADGSMDLFGVIRTAADMGFEGIEFSGLPGSEKESDLHAFATRVRETCSEAGLPIVSYTIPADFLNPSNGDWKDEVERLKSEVKIASILGAPKMRHDATRGPKDGKLGLTQVMETLPTVADGCRAVTSYAADLGIKTMVENHGFFMQDSDRCAALMDAVNHPNFGALVDIGNFLCADEAPLPAVTRMATYAVHAHAKDFHIKPANADPGQEWFQTRGGNWLRGAIIGHGNVDVPSCLSVLLAAGYDDFISIEFEGMEDNRRALEIGMDNLRRYIAQLR